MKIVSSIIICALLFLGFVSSKKNDANVKVEVSIFPEEGFMNGGYGSIKFKFINISGEEVSTSKVTAEWSVGEEKYNQWNYTPNLIIPTGEDKSGSLIVWMPPKTEKLAKETIPNVEGFAKVMVAGEEISIPFSVEVPVAKLASPLKSEKGKYTELILQESTWGNVNHPAKVGKYIDDVYTVMLDLTGRQPYNGDIMGIKECPRNPYFAYAGNPIVLNTAFVAKSVASFDNDQVDFGWVHEVGHDFDDVIGHYYNYGTYTEFQANIKLSFAIEQLCTEESKLRIKSWLDKESLLTGKAFNDEYFAPFGKKYLNDPKRTWESLASDEYHSLFHLVIRRHGWEVMKKYYRTFGELSEKELKAPKGINRILLALTVLNHSCIEDLLPLYKKWRIPLGKNEFSSIKAKYKLD